MRLHVGRQHSQFCSILTRFVDYYSLFWGPGLISTINEPLGRLRVIRLERIYNFLLFHAIILPLLDVYGLLFYTFISFLGLTY